MLKEFLKTPDIKVYYKLQMQKFLSFQVIADYFGCSPLCGFSSHGMIHFLPAVHVVRKKNLVSQPPVKRDQVGIGAHLVA